MRILMIILCAGLVYGEPIIPKLKIVENHKFEHYTILTRNEIINTSSDTADTIMGVIISTNAAAQEGRIDIVHSAGVIYGAKQGVIGKKYKLIKSTVAVPQDYKERKYILDKGIVKEADYAR